MPPPNLIWAISGLWQLGGSVKSSNDPVSWSRTDSAILRWMQRFVRCHGSKIKSDRVNRCSEAVVPTVAVMSKQETSSTEIMPAPSNSRMLHNVEDPWPALARNVVCSDIGLTTSADQSFGIAPIARNLPQDIVTPTTLSALHQLWW